MLGRLAASELGTMIANPSKQQAKAMWSLLAIFSSCT
jgi:hypothetical protein